MNIVEREQIPELLKHGSVGCEIGVFEGDYSQILIDSGKFSKFYVVDLFSGPSTAGDKYGNNVRTYNDGSVLYEKNKARFSSYNFVEVLKEDGISFLKRMVGLLDFVYIDTLHTYHQTINELETAYISVRDGGIISGHDYNETEYPGLVRAVKEFCAKSKLEAKITSKDNLESFIIIK